MESERFDAVTRRLSTAATRRGMLGVLAGLIGAVRALPPGGVAVAARPKNNHHRRRAKARADTRKRDGLPCIKDGQCGSGHCCRDEGEKHGVCGVPDCTGRVCGDPDGCGGTCTGGCPICQTCTDGACAADPALRHTCEGPCPSGQWCDAGACADIQATVTIPDCGGLCGQGSAVDTATICGQTVTCPGCLLNCGPQTGCLSPVLFQDGPKGPGWYCASTTYLPGPAQTCTPGGDPCPPPGLCGGLGTHFCAAICPF